MKQPKSIKAKKGAWFIKVRGSYLPISREGWLTYIPYAAFLFFSLFVCLIEVRPFQVAILIIVPNWLAAFLVMTFIAAKKS